VESADDGCAGGGGFDGVVVAHFAGEVEVRLLGEGVAQEFAARAGAGGGFPDRS